MTTRHHDTLVEYARSLFLYYGIIRTEPPFISSANLAALISDADASSALLLAEKSALELIADIGCEDTWHIRDAEHSNRIAYCAKYKKSKKSEWRDDSWCAPCIAIYTLNGDRVEPR